MTELSDLCEENARPLESLVSTRQMDYVHDGKSSKEARAMAAEEVAGLVVPPITRSELESWLASMRWKRNKGKRGVPPQSADPKPVDAKPVEEKGNGHSQNALELPGLAPEQPERKASRALAALLYAWASTHEIIPQDEVIAHFAQVKASAIHTARSRMRSVGWKFEQREDGSFRASPPPVKRADVAAKPPEAPDTKEIGFSQEDMAALKVLIAALRIVGP